jgi:hypothetical protein
MVLAVGFFGGGVRAVQLGSGCVVVVCDESGGLLAALMFSNFSWFTELSLYGLLAE